MIYNNGYVVKSLQEHEWYTQKFGTYFGIGSFTSWPLKYIAKYDELNQKLEPFFLERDKGFFLSERYRTETPFVIELIRDEDVICEYIENCKKEKIETIIMRVESEIPIRESESRFHVVEQLGWDCLAQSYYTYLDELDFIDRQGILKSKLNKNGLFDAIDDVKQFIRMREIAMDNGMDLEDAFEPIPARLSIVECGKAPF